MSNFEVTFQNLQRLVRGIAECGMTHLVPPARPLEPTIEAAPVLLAQAQLLLAARETRGDYHGWLESLESHSRELRALLPAWQDHLDAGEAAKARVESAKQGAAAQAAEQLAVLDAARTRERAEAARGAKPKARAS